MKQFLENVQASTHRRQKTTRSKVMAIAATLAIVGGLSFSPLSPAGGVASAQAATPTSIADCRNWRDFGFQNRASCVSYVQTHPSNGYGGGGGGGGAIGSIGRFIADIFTALGNLLRSLFGFFF